jgi:hypothetical protein
LSAPSLSSKQETFALGSRNASEPYRRAYNAGGMNPASVNREALGFSRQPQDYHKARTPFS